MGKGSHAPLTRLSCRTGTEDAAALQVAGAAACSALTRA
jgi:hypothetical protein